MTIYPRTGALPVGTLDGEWRDHALCRNHPSVPPETWDDTLLNAKGEAKERNGKREARVERAKAVCDRCPVRLACLADVDLDFDEGIRGGVDLRDMKAARRRKAS